MTTWKAPGARRQRTPEGNGNPAGARSAADGCLSRDGGAHSRPLATGLLLGLVFATVAAGLADRLLAQEFPVVLRQE